MEQMERQETNGGVQMNAPALEQSTLSFAGHCWKLEPNLLVTLLVKLSSFSEAALASHSSNSNL